MRFLISVVCIVLAGHATASQIRYLPLQYTNVNDVWNEENSPILPGESQIWKIDAINCTGPQQYLHVELWDLDQLESVDEANKAFSDKLLIMAKGMIPHVSMPTTGTLSFYPPLMKGEGEFESHYDAEGWLLMRSYHHVSAPVHQTLENASDWFVTVYNLDTWIQNSLERFIIKASCVNHKPCPSPLPFQQPCTDNGVCISDLQRNGCRCQQGWGDVGCSVSMQLLPADVLQEHDNLRIRNWAYLELDVREDVRGFVIEMTRLSGDPILFVKAAMDERYLRSSVPSVKDYPSSADAQSLRLMSNRHHITRRLHTPQLFYIAVYNNPGRIAETARFELEAHLIRNTPRCPFDCSSNGRCMFSGDESLVRCQCNPGYVGRLCGSTRKEMHMNDEIIGVLAPGESAYFDWPLSKQEMKELPKEIELHLMVEDSEQLHYFLCADHNGLPSIMMSTYKFIKKLGRGGKSVHQIFSKTLSKGNLTFGLFNIDLYVHKSFKYSLKLVPTEQSFLYNLLAVFILGIATTIVVSLFFLVIKIMILKLSANRQRQLLEEEDGRLSAQAQHLLNRLERSIFRLTTTEKSTPSNSSEETLCSICICEYREGDVQVTLPCDHIFHEGCITQWFHRNSSCPICRQSIIPEQSSSVSARDVEMTERDNDVA